MYTTLTCGEMYKRSKGRATADSHYLKQLHPSQVFACLRLLGCSGTGALRSHLMQVRTGEGKSIVLGCVAAVLGLVGKQVSVVCYSEYLSERDYADFKPVFAKLHLEDCVSYDIITRYIEKKVRDLRVVTSNLLRAKDGLTSTASDALQTREEVLLVDEVDVFFGDNVLGGTFNQVAEIEGIEIRDMIVKVWELGKASQDPKQLIDEATKSDEYNRFKTRFGPDWQAFAYREVARMCMQRQEVPEIPYEFDGERIGYVENDAVDWDVSFGYVTMFHYLQEKDSGCLQASVLESKLKLQVSCARFAYSEVELPEVILGVSGTVGDLTADRREILQTTFGIDPEQHSRMPSVFGESNLRFLDSLRQFNPLLICNESDHALEIAKAIDEQLDNARSVLVFFESDAALKAFASSSHFQGLSCGCKTQELVASVPAKERKRIVFNAATLKHVTLCTAAFGRGTDFISHDDQLLENGGVHVIQTFFSMDKSEETQIMGRTARQGQKGSYSMILSKQDLQKKGLQNIPQGIPAEIYGELCDFRVQHDASWKSNIETKLKEAGKYHKASCAYADAAETGSPDIVRDAFYAFQQTAVLTGGTRCSSDSHVVFCRTASVQIG